MESPKLEGLGAMQEILFIQPQNRVLHRIASYVDR